MYFLLLPWGEGRWRKCLSLCLNLPEDKDSQGLTHYREEKKNSWPKAIFKNKIRLIKTFLAHSLKLSHRIQGSKNTSHLLCKYINFCSVAWWELLSCNSQSCQCAGKQRNCYYATRNWEIRKNEKLWNYITLPAVIRYENTVNAHVTAIQHLMREPTSIWEIVIYSSGHNDLAKRNHELKESCEFAAYLTEKWKPLSWKYSWTCWALHMSLPILIFSLNLFSRVIHFQPGACWTIHFKYTVWLI